MYKFFIALRYLTSRPISLVSIIGILLSVGALIVVVSVMSGFLRETKAYIRGTMSDIVVMPYPQLHRVGDRMEIGDYPPYEKLEKIIRSVEGVNGISPRFVRPALLRRSDGIDPYVGSSKLNDINFTKVLGISVESEQEVSNLDFFLENLEDPAAMVDDVENPFSMDKKYKGARNRSRDYPCILLGEDRMDRLGLRKGSVVTLATLDESSLDDGEELKAFEEKFFVSGAFRSGNHQFDIQHVIIEMDVAWNWVGAEGEVSEIYVSVDDYARQGMSIRNEMDERMRREEVDAAVETWEQRNAIFLGAVENERTILGVILAFFIIIATFNVYATISMMVTDKTKDIGIMVSMGATSFGIMGTFVLCGLFMWLIGSLLGAIGGYIFAANINAIKDFIENLFGIEVFRNDIYNFKEIPVELSPTFTFLIVLGTFFICLFFSLLPSLRASWMDPVKALRRE